MDRINNNTGGIIYLDAPGGTRKTYKTEILIPLASSGIAATMMTGVRTPHAAQKVLLKIVEEQFPVYVDFFKQVLISSASVDFEITGSV
ncbi:hypothetical protein EVAR_437_1 [Eumeta japonica]|uniref:ATP-dependent DNA helicase n=1 Tax=Eumeta variegata TaxID=151549 RepID=A0A4C1SAF4_EUMVA|nr:hypothetical protein EVAR_437_1 [Eumeta japonica]